MRWTSRRKSGAARPNCNPRSTERCICGVPHQPAGGLPLGGSLRLHFSRRPLMGWYFSPQSRSELIAELIAPQETERASVKVIAHALRGNVLWSVTQVTAKADGVHRDLAPGQSLRYIRCDLLQRSGGQWGYKPLDESHRARSKHRLHRLRFFEEQ